jgi:hypothetical protein
MTQRSECAIGSFQRRRVALLRYVRRSRRKRPNRSFSAAKRLSCSRAETRSLPRGSAARRASNGARVASKIARARSNGACRASTGGCGAVNFDRRTVNFDRLASNGARGARSGGWIASNLARASSNRALIGSSRARWSCSIVIARPSTLRGVSRTDFGVFADRSSRVDDLGFECRGSANPGQRAANVVRVHRFIGATGVTRDALLSFRLRSARYRSC